MISGNLFNEFSGEKIKTRLDILNNKVVVVFFGKGRI